MDKVVRERLARGVPADCRARFEEIVQNMAAQNGGLVRITQRDCEMRWRDVSFAEAEAICRENSSWKTTLKGGFRIVDGIGSMAPLYLEVRIPLQSEATPI